ncbi:DUF1992 domain-containing protein [Paenibacillus sp. GCM10027629]|uniref:DnaJ family domain-containing protein n=1 Tax=Paenibacillus sp. GCM10027629 TaxID=3273414 RepID=UPI00362DEDBC
MFWKRWKSRQEPSTTPVIQEGNKQSLSSESNTESIANEEVREEIGYMSVTELAIRDYERKGGFQDLPGKNKPLEVSQGDVLHSVLKTAHVLPAWLELQHEIREEIRLLLEQQDEQTLMNMNERVDKINQKIGKYNQLVPSSLFQKRKVSAESLHEQYENWV